MRQERRSNERKSARCLRYSREAILVLDMSCNFRASLYKMYDSMIPMCCNIIDIYSLLFQKDGDWE